MKTRKRKKRRPDLDTLLGNVFGGTDLARQFRMMGVVEEELDALGFRTARTAGGASLFYALRPSQPFATVRNLEVFRSHVLELIARHRDGEALEPATKIEVALAILECSKAAPLNRLGLATLALAAKFTPLEEHIDPDWHRLERYTGQAAIELDTMRKKLRVEDRARPS